MWFTHQGPNKNRSAMAMIPRRRARPLALFRKIDITLALATDVLL
jgi:hypothetical protein